MSTLNALICIFSILLAVKGYSGEKILKSSERRRRAGLKRLEEKVTTRLQAGDQLTLTCDNLCIPQKYLPGGLNNGESVDFIFTVNNDISSSNIIWTATITNVVLHRSNPNELSVKRRVAKLLALRNTQVVYKSERLLPRGDISKEIMVLSFLGRLYVHGIQADGTRAMLMEFVPETMPAAMIRVNAMANPVLEKLKLFKSSLESLQALRNIHYHHNDLKIDNLMVDANGKGLVIDFDFARLDSDSCVDTTTARTPFIKDDCFGSGPLVQSQIPPEAGLSLANPLLNKPIAFDFDNEASDVWSMSIVFFIAIFNGHPIHLVKDNTGFKIPNTGFTGTVLTELNSNLIVAGMEFHKTANMNAAGNSWSFAPRTYIEVLTASAGGVAAHPVLQMFHKLLFFTPANRVKTIQAAINLVNAAIVANPNANLPAGIPTVNTGVAGLSNIPGQYNPQIFTPIYTRKGTTSSDMYPECALATFATPVANAVTIDEMFLYPNAQCYFRTRSVQDQEFRELVGAFQSACAVAITHFLDGRKLATLRTAMKQGTLAPTITTTLTNTLIQRVLINELSAENAKKAKKKKVSEDQLMSDCLRMGPTLAVQYQQVVRKAAKDQFCQRNPNAQQFGVNFC